MKTMVPKTTFAALAFAALAFGALPVFAANSTVNGDWTNNDSWDTTNYPNSASENVMIKSNIDLSGGTVSANEVYIGRDGVLGNLSVGTGGVLNINRRLMVGTANSAGNVTVNGGTIKWTATQAFYIGHWTTGVLNVESGLFDATGGAATSYVAENASGTLNISDSGQVKLNNLVVGNTTAHGVVRMTGGSLEAKEIYIGNGSSAGGTGTLHVGGDSTTLTANRIFVGGKRNGTFNLSGGLVTLTESGASMVGQTATASGTMNISGGELNSSGSLVLANAAGANGTLNLNAGSASTLKFTAANGLRIGMNGNGELNADGATSTITAPLVTLGYTGTTNAAANAGAGTMNIRNGSSIAINGNVILGSQAAATYAGSSKIIIDAASELKINGNLTLRKSAKQNTITFAIGDAADGFGGISADNILLDSTGTAPKIIVDFTKFVADANNTFSQTLMTAAGMGALDGVVSLEYYFGTGGIDSELAALLGIDYDSILETWTSDKLMLSFNYTPVPEPSTYAVLLGALAFVALALRRRK